MRFRFVERNGEVDYVQIHPGDGGCYAVIPYRIGAGMREVGLQQSGCVYTKVDTHTDPSLLLELEMNFCLDCST